MQEVLNALNRIDSLLSEAENRANALDAIAGALAGGIPTHAPIQNEAQVNVATNSELLNWKASWLSCLGSGA